VTVEVVRRNQGFEVDQDQAIGRSLFGRAENEDGLPWTNRERAIPATRSLRPGADGDNNPRKYTLVVRSVAHFGPSLSTDPDDRAGHRRVMKMAAQDIMLGVDGASDPRSAQFGAPSPLHRPTRVPLRHHPLLLPVTGSTQTKRCTVLGHPLGRRIGRGTQVT
jgi:hypothetical protein